VTPTDIDSRVEVVRRRDAFDRDPDAFMARWAGEDARIRRRIARARKALPAVDVPRTAVEHAAGLCIALGTDGIRGELTLVRAARALAALEGRSSVEVEQLRQVAPSALRHRLRRNPLDDTGSTARVLRAIDEVLGA
jgi:magnesium chelatase subunit I